MKAMLTYSDGSTTDVDVWRDDNKPVYADTWHEMEQSVIRDMNRNTPPDCPHVVKCKIFRTGERHTPREIYELFHPPLFKDEPQRQTIGDHVSKKDFAPSKGKKKRIRIW